MSRSIRISPLILASLFYANGVLGQEIPAARQIANWPAPLSWTPSGETMSASEGVGPGGARGLTPLSTTAVPLTSPEPFVGITPCRIVNTTGNGGFSGAYGPPALSGGAPPRNFTLTGQCGIPGSAVAVSLNITVTNTLGPGFIKIYPQGAATAPVVSTLNYVAGQTVANAAVVPLGTGGGISVVAGVSGTDLIIDTNGYYGSTAADGSNVFLGPSAGNSTMSGIRNTAIGHETIPGNTSGNDNTAIGSLALNANTTGNLNTAVGRVALINNTSGSGNTALGVGAGANLTTGGNNIDIGNAGVAAESNTIRIGSTQTKFVVAGVRDATVLGDANPVLIDSTGTLGQTPFSSAKWKRDIADIGEESSALLQLRPVSFYYTSDTAGVRQYGLIAEEVVDVMPSLVKCSANGEPEAVRYQFLVPMLVNEIQKDRKTIQEQSSEIQEIKAELQRLEALISVRADRETTPRP